LFHGVSKKLTVYPLRVVTEARKKSDHGLVSFCYNLIGLIIVYIFHCISVVLNLHVPLFTCFVLNCNFEHLCLCIWPLTFAFNSVEPEMTVLGRSYRNLNHSFKAQTIDNIVAAFGEITLLVLH
jgi:hypothetical protein